MKSDYQQRFSSGTRFVVASLCAWLIAITPLVPAASQSAPKAVPTQTVSPSVSEQMLPNGLKVVLLEDHSFPVVSCMTWYRVGARNETVGCTGITHLLEHMLFGSVGSFRRGEIASTIARVGGQFNGYTSDDFTTFFETLPASKLELGLKVESERMRKAVFSNKDLQEEMVNVQAEFENETTDANATLSREVRAMLYLTHPYHNPTMGWRTDVENITTQQLKEYYDHYFWPVNCTLVISGDINSEAASALVNKYFGSVPPSPNPVPFVKVTEPQQRGERHIVVKYPGKQEALQVAYHAPAFDDADAPAMVVLQKILNANYAGRLRARLVDPKICTSAVSAFEAKKDPGYFSITCCPQPGSANAQQKISDALDGVITQLRSQPASEVEMKRARNLSELAYYTEQEGPYRAGFHLGYWDILSRWQNAVSWPDKLRSVSAADVQRVAKRYLNADNRVVAWLSGTASAHCVPSKPAGDASVPPKNAPSHAGEHSHLTGYKLDDDALSPSGREKFSYLLAQLAVERDSLGKRTSVKPAGDAPVSDKPNSDAVHKAIQDIPKALPAAVKDLPSAIGGAPGAIKELPNAVEKVPTVIKSLPAAVSSIPGVIKELPSAVGSVPQAIKQIPGAIGGLPSAAASAAKNLPSAIVGLPGTAANTLKELPGTLTAIPGAAASAIKGMPSAIGSIVGQVGSIPGAMIRPNGPRFENMPVFHRTLKNGVNLVVFPTHLSPIVQVQGAVQAGAAYEPPGKNGLSETVAALFNNGTSERGRAQIVTQQEDMGLAPAQMLRFYATADSVRFSSRFLARDLPAQLDLIAQTLSSPAAEDADIDKARQELLASLKQEDDSAQTRAGRALMRSLLSSSSPFLPAEPAELLRSVPNLSAADVHKFIDDHVAPSATTVVIAGDLDPEQAAQAVEHAFGAWGARGAHQRLHVQPNNHHVVRTSVPSHDRSQTVIGFGQLVPIARSGAEFGNLLIADALISNHPLLSRLNKVLASQPQLAHALNDEPIEADIKPLANAVAWSFVVAVEPNAVPAVVETIQAELKQLSGGGISADELTEMKRYLLGALPVRSMSTISGIAETLLETCEHFQEGEGVYNEINSVRAATVESVNKTIRNVLRPSEATLVIVGSPQSIRSVRSQVVGQSSDSTGDSTGNNVASKTASP